jgi:hypothetical protein
MPIPALLSERWSQFLLGAARIQGQEMVNHGLVRPLVVAQSGGLQIGVGLGHATMLAQVLGPGLDQEPLDHPTRLAGVLGHAPGISPIDGAPGPLAAWPGKRRPGLDAQSGTRSES